jgi:hypothetical protein
MEEKVPPKEFWDEISLLRGYSVPEYFVQIIFIYAYSSSLYIIVYSYLNFHLYINLFLYDVYYCYKTHNNVIIFYLFLLLNFFLQPV